MTDLLDDLDPPERGDFQRDGKGIPRVWDEQLQKMIRYRRSSSAGKIMDDEYNLWDWKLRTELVGAAQRPELMAVVSTLDPQADKKKLRDIAEQCLEAGRGSARATQGSAVHSMFDHVDLEHDWTPAPQFQQIVDAYLETTQGFYGLIPIDVEVRCVNDRHKLAGTLDRRYRTTRTLVAPDGQIIPIGSIIVGDTKTGTTLEYAAGAYSTQLAAYVDSVRYDTATNQREAFDPPNYPDWAIIVHAVPELGTCEIYWVDITAGRAGLVLADQVREWRGRTDLLTPASPPQRASQEPPSAPVSDDQPSEASAQPDEPSEPVGEPGDELREWLRGRVQAIRAHGDIPTRRLQALWPEGVPGLKAEGHSPGELELISEALYQVEAEYSVPFGPIDPRETAALEQSKRTHPSNQQPMSPAIGRAVLVNLWGTGVTEDAVLRALVIFAGITPSEEWSDDDLSTMLDGTIRAMGYMDGLQALGRLTPEDAPHLISAAFAISSGTAMLLFDAQDKPVVRFNVQTIEQQRKGADNE
jgi:hypothetical protein